MKKPKSSPSPLLAEISQDVHSPTSVPATDLAKVASVSAQIVTLQDRISHGEDLLSNLREQLFVLQTETLPGLMETFGLKEFKLKDGSKVTIHDIVTASLPTESAIEKQKDPDQQEKMRARFSAGLAYLKAKGAASIIKNSLKADLGKDSEKKAKEAVTLLRRLGIPASVSRGVHPQTLTSWVRERLNGGLDVDFNLLAVWSGQKAEIKMADSKQTK